jgi:AraC family transcriptional regulator, regulatory protein of adaptative response / methylated-DNA-[protein]-cysteine methyltransferase
MIEMSSARPDTGTGNGSREAVTRIIKDSTAASKGCDLLKADWIETPIGAILAVADTHALHLLKF